MLQGTWNTVPSDDAQVMALTAELKKHEESHREQSSLIAALHSRLTQLERGDKDRKREGGRKRGSEAGASSVLKNKPNDITKPITHNDKNYWWCTECNRCTNSHGDHHPDQKHERGKGRNTNSAKKSRSQDKNPPSSAHHSNLNKRISEFQVNAAKLSLTRSLEEFAKSDPGSS
jgi:hypothetical protein